MAQRTAQSLHTLATHYAQRLANYQGMPCTKWLTPWSNPVQWSAEGLRVAQATNLPGFSIQGHHEVGLWGRLGVIGVGDPLEHMMQN